MKYFVRVNGRDHEVELTERLGQLDLRVDGEPLALEYEEVDDQGQVLALVEGRSYAVSIQEEQGRCALTIAGHFYDVELEDERERAAHAADRKGAGGGGVVLSVMPGVVVSLLVSEGQQVEAGEPLLILEAMKMQNEIEAPATGTVEILHVEQGRAVRAGEKLVTLRPRVD